MKRTSLAVLVAFLLAVPAAGDNWPYWRGPERSGVSAETGVPLSWSAEENVRWKLSLPDLSGSTPIVWGNRIFLNVAEGEALSLWAVDAADGSVAWKRPLGGDNVKKRKGNMSSPSPVTDGEHVWVMTGTGVIKAFDMAGAERWARDLQADYGAFGIYHGYSSSPLLYGDLLVVQVLHGTTTDDPSYVIAFDRATGETRWRVERPTDAPREAPDAYTTPALLDRGDRTEIVVSGGDYVTGHDPATGQELWRVAGLNPEKRGNYRVVASPIVAGEMLYAPSRVKPLLAFSAAADGGAPERRWSTDRGPDVPTPVVDGGYLYILTDNGIAWCLDAATGEAVWGPERISASTYSASPVLAEGRIYVTDEAGKTTVIAAGPEFKVLAENPVDEYTLSSLAVAGGAIYLRTAKHLFSIANP